MKIKLLAMLLALLACLLPDAKPIVHSDHGCHYRWPGWIRRMQGSDVPCQRKDVLRTTLPARAFSGI